MTRSRVAWLLAAASLAIVAGCSNDSSSSDGPNEPSATCAAAPAAPAAPTVAGISTGIAVVSWTAPEIGAGCALTGYRVYDGEAEVGAVAPGVTTFAVTGLTPGSSHALSVAALDAVGASDRSPALAVTTRTAPDLGPNTLILDPATPAADTQAAIDAVYAAQESVDTAQFDSGRFALLFKPGAYSVDVGMGYYMQAAGLGALPGDVTITGRVHSEGHFSGWSTGGMNATQNFWRGLENFTVVPTANVGTVPLDGSNTTTDDGGVYMRWAVSQACPFRRMHVAGPMQLHHWGGWASGGWISDSRIDGEVSSGSQQQFFVRNAALGSWSNVNWNMVFLGVDNPYPGAWPDAHTTVVDATPLVREKPFLYLDAAGAFRVYVPALREGSASTTWSDAVQTPGTSRSIDSFYVATPADTVATLNAVLAAGGDLLLTPGIYHLDGALEVTQPNTVVLGLGFATLHPDTGAAAMEVADADGVILAGLLFDAGTVNSPVLLRVGPEGSAADHSANPTSLHDLFFRIGGAEAGKADVGMIVNSQDVIGDHFWIWRADHGSGVGWTENPSTNGLIVNGDDVTIYGLFVEHFEEYQTLWNGERGRTYFYQSEDPYDVPDQASWMSSATKRGYASYKVADGVASHEAWGLGVYSVFNVFPAVQDSAIEVPDAAGVTMHNMITFGLSQGTVTHVINDVGDPATSNPWAQGVVVEYPVPSP